MKSATTFQQRLRWLNEKQREYESPAFIAGDPISVPHQYSKKQDIEIAGFFAATLAWGQRTTIIRSTQAILQAMDNAPHDFLQHHQQSDLKRFLLLKHRTFNATDLLYFIERLSTHYKQHASLESAFHVQGIKHPSMEERLSAFQDWFFIGDYPERTRKHVATPARGSACKRLNMFLRWMVRSSAKGVDFGLWHSILPAHLVCPLDVHVGRVAHRLQLIPHNKADWKTALLLTEALRTLDPTDPVKYDYALFALGAEERFK